MIVPPPGPTFIPNGRPGFATDGGVIGVAPIAGCVGMRGAWTSGASTRGAVVSHPFFTLSVTLEGGVAWGLDDVEDSEDIWPYVDTYLAHYAPDRPELREAVPAALRLGWVCRALNQPEVSGDEHTRTRLRMFLDGRPE